MAYAIGGISGCHINPAITIGMLVAGKIELKDAIFPFSFESVNPARNIGPALFLGGLALSQLWLFIVAPILGAVISAMVWKNLLEPKEA